MGPMKTPSNLGKTLIDVKRFNRGSILTFGFNGKTRRWAKRDIFGITTYKVEIW